MRYAIVGFDGSAEKPSPISVLVYMGDGIVNEDYLTNIRKLDIIVFTSPAPCVTCSRQKYSYQGLFYCLLHKCNKTCLIIHNPSFAAKLDYPSSLSMPIIDCDECCHFC